MTSSYHGNYHEISNLIIATFQADTNWMKYMRNKYILILTISGLVIIVLSIIFQNFYVAIIRGIIFLVAGLITYFKPETSIISRIQILRDGKITIKKGFITIITEGIPSNDRHFVKKGKYWVIGQKKVKVPIGAFPNLENEIKTIKF